MKSVVLCMILFCLLLCGCASAGDYSVRVLLAEGEGFTVAGDNPVTVRAGEDAVFSVELAEGWQVAKADGIWSDGTLTVPSVYFPATVHLTVTDAEEKVRFFVERAGEGKGKTGTTAEEYMLYPGVVAEAWAQPDEDSVFVGWSLQKALDNGGTLLSTETKIQHTVSGYRTFLYANFAPIVTEEPPAIGSDNLSGPTKSFGKYGVQGNESTHMIAYDVNGGHVVGYENSRVFYDEVSTAVFSCPNTLPEMGYFKRDGYLLLEYNTKPDGSGDAIPCGGKFLPRDKQTTLYCIWTPVTDESLFTVTDTGKGVAINGYKGREKTLVIPEAIDGKPVVRIKKGAITDGSFTTLVLPKTMEVVENGAFTNSKSMKTLYFYDTIQTITDQSFSDLSGWKHLRLIAAQHPRYSQHEDATFCRKWERLLAVAETDAKKILVHSGSSSFHALSSPQFMKGMNGEYEVINFGNLARAQVTFFMDAVADFLDGDDIMIHAPETGYDGVMGNNEFHWTVFRAIEYNYDMLYHVDDIGFYVKLLDAFTEFNGYRAKMEPQDYDIFTTYIDEYGDHTADRKNNGNPNKFYGKDIDLTDINEEWIGNLNTMYNRIMDETGCRIVMSFAPFNYNALTSASRSEEARETFMRRLTELLDIPVISHIWDYMQTGDMMYNSDYHPGDEGRVIRTDLLIRDLKAFLAKEDTK